MKKIFAILTMIILIAAGPGISFAGEDDGIKIQPRHEDNPGDCESTPNEYDEPPIILCDLLGEYFPFCSE